MAVSNPAVPNIHTAPEAECQLLREAQYHAGTSELLQVFMFIVLAHWGEHLFQAYQIYVMGWPRPKANGLLGLWYPWLIKSETLHYGYALVMLIGLWVLRKGFTGRCANLVDGRPGDPVLASHRAFPADLAGHDSP